MCSYLTGAGAQAAPSRPRPPPLRNLEKMGARMEEVCRFAGSTTPALPRRLEIVAAVAGNLNIAFRVPALRVVQSKDGF